jgi:hypothetical protein
MFRAGCGNDRRQSGRILLARRRRTCYSVLENKETERSIGSDPQKEGTSMKRVFLALLIAVLVLITALVACGGRHPSERSDCSGCGSCALGCAACAIGCAACTACSDMDSYVSAVPDGIDAY